MVEIDSGKFIWYHIRSRWSLEYTMERFSGTEIKTDIKDGRERKRQK